MNERLTLSTKELVRIRACELIMAGQLTVTAAAVGLGLSERQCWRVLARYRREGAAGLAHGNRGKPSPQRVDEATRQRIVLLAKREYPDYNDQHLSEQLATEHRIAVSVATVRRIRRGAGLASPRQYRRRKGHVRRERFAQRGMLLQLDASPYDWLEGRGSKLSLVAAIDDATGEVVGAVFRPQEDAAGYFLVLQAVARHYGLPVAVYADRHTIFQSPSKRRVDEQLLGVPPHTHFSRLLAQLAVRLIAAHSPQAKGRIERLWLTLQDRLVKALRRAGAHSLEDANAVLEHYLPQHNQRFAVAPAAPASAFRPLPAGLDLTLDFAFRYQRQVANDHTISFAGHKLPLPATVNGRSYAKAKVELRHTLDGTLHVFHQGRPLTTFAPSEPGAPRPDRFSPHPADTPPARPVQPAQPAPRKGWQEASRPAPNHPWRRYKNPLPPPPVPPSPTGSEQPDIFTDRLS